MYLDAAFKNELKKYMNLCKINNDINLKELDTWN